MSKPFSFSAYFCDFAERENQLLSRSRDVRQRRSFVIGMLRRLSVPATGTETGEVFKKYVDEIYNLKRWGNPAADLQFLSGLLTNRQHRARFLDVIGKSEDKNLKRIHMQLSAQEDFDYSNIFAPLQGGMSLSSTHRNALHRYLKSLYAATDPAATSAVKLPVLKYGLDYYDRQEARYRHERSTRYDFW